MEYRISAEYLQELIDEVSKRVVGKVMKRHDILGVDTMAKTVSKELIYEGFREFRDLLAAHNKGLNISVFKFKNRNNGDIPTH